MALNEWAVCLANTLTKPYIYMNEHINKEKLTQKIDFIQSSINNYNKHSENYKNNPNLSEEDKKVLNLWRWYHSNRKSYHSDKYNISKIDKNLLDDFKKDPYYVLKNSVEIIWKKLVSKLFENSLKWTLNNVKVYTTTDIDDIKWWADLIVVLDEKGEKSYVWIDIAVSDSQEYLSVKNTKKESVCQEFNLYKWLHINTKIRRMVLDFERIIINWVLWFCRKVNWS